MASDSDSDDLSIILGMNIILTAASAIIAKNKKRRRRKRRWSVRPINFNRNSFGQFHILFLNMKESDPEQFFKYTRMNVNIYNKLLALVAPKIQKRKTVVTLTPEHRLAMTLLYLSQGASMQTVAWAYHVARCTVSIVIRETCAAIWEVLFPVYLPTPSVNDFRRIEEGFRHTWQFPNCVGALDGKHINIQAPKKSGSEFFSYKKTFSIVLMASCDADLNFTMIDIGAYGSQSDGGIFSNSTFGSGIQNSDISLPMEKQLPGTQIFVPHFLVADEAFPLKSYIMRPYPGISLDREKMIYNYRLSRARRTIENTFGILASRWRIFRSNIIADVENVEKIVAAAVCLHNFILKEELQISSASRRYCPSGFSDSYDDAGNVLQGKWRNQVDGNCLQRIGRLGSNYSARDTTDIREKLKDYFCSEEGSVPWQWRHISRGSQPTV